jgi:hypothetical protein
MNVFFSQDFTGVFKLMTERTQMKRDKELRKTTLECGFLNNLEK